MKRIILSALVALTAFGGVASADRYRGPSVHREQGGVSVSPSRGQYPQRQYPQRQYQRQYQPQYQRQYQRQYPQRSTYSRRYSPQRHYTQRYYPQRSYSQRYQPQRRIYVQRPVIRHRYYNYYQRPAIIVENYAPMTGYYWVPGQWDWNGYEWLWTPGHYELDPAYYPGY